MTGRDSTMDAVVLRKERPIGFLFLGARFVWRLMRMKETKRGARVHVLRWGMHASVAQRIVWRQECEPAKGAKQVTAQHGRRNAATRTVHGAGPGALR